MIWTQDSAFVLNENEIELRGTKGAVYLYTFDCNGDKPARSNDYMDLNFRGGPEKMSVWATLI